MKFYFFDLDGTLADTDPDIRGAWKTVFERMGLNCPDFNEKFVAGPPLEEMMKTLFPESYTDEMGARARVEFGKAYDTCGFLHTPEYPGVMDAVRAIRNRGGRVFIVTNKRLLGARALAAKYGWMDVFEGLYTGDMFVGEGLEGLGGLEGLESNAQTSKHPNTQTPKHPNAQTTKPNTKLRKPELLAYVMNELDASKDESVMIGDTVSDFEAAQKNGIRSVGVAWGYGKPEELAMADRIARTPEEI